MADILNLDELLPEPRSIRFEGVSHVMEAVSTATYLRLIQLRKKMGKPKTDEEREETEALLSLEMLSLALPTIDKEKLQRLPLQLIAKMVALISEEMDMSTANIATTDAEDSRGQGEPMLVLLPPA